MPRIVNRRPNAGDNINGFAFKYDADLDAMVSVDDVPAEAAANFLLLDDITEFGEKIKPDNEGGTISPDPAPEQVADGAGPTEGAPAAEAGATDKQKHQRPKAAQVAKPQA